MPGIGKTTLAKRIYNDPLMLEHFDARAWVTLSTEKSYYEDPVRRVSMHLPQTKRNLVVIDNICDADVWYALERLLFGDRKGSAYILTTTNADLARRTCQWKISFLNDDASWELLRRVVFDNEKPSPQLESIGRKIAKNCEGHPLAIIEVGKLLRRTEKTVANWKAVEEDENPLIISANDDTPLSKALTPSYKSLPPHLKACFLYMGLLPRNTDIRRSKLIRLWVSEGFIERGKSKKTLEIKAENYLHELISRSLVLVGKHSCNGDRFWSRGRTKTCRMHFVFRGLCISEAPKQDFFHIIKKLDNDGVPQGTRINTQQQLQRICFHNNIVLGFKPVRESLDSISSARSLLLFGPHHQYPIEVYLRPFRLLRVLDLIALRFYMFPNGVVELVRLRYLAITYDGELPPSISMLLNLEVLVVRRHHHIIKSSDVDYLPIEIWNLHKLKHLHCMGSDLVDPSTNGLDMFLVLENLWTLSGVSGRSCVPVVLTRMPNLKKIGIRVVVQSTTHGACTETFSFLGYFSKYYSWCLSFFKRGFESFKCVVVNPSLGVVSPSIKPYFYVYTRKMTLSGCGFPWKDMSVIAELPCLEMLKLRWYAFRGPVWEMGQSEFTRLEFLLLEDLDLEYWGTIHECFRRLQCLIIRHCYKLENLDLDLFDVSSLEMIEVDDCSLATETWARGMGENKNNTGRLSVNVHSSRDAKNEA